MGRVKRKQSPVQKKKSAKGTNSPGTPQSEIVQEALKSSNEEQGESVIPVEKGEIQGDKHGVHLKEPLFVKKIKTRQK